MSKKIFAIFFLILLFINAFYLVFNNKVFAMEPAQDEYRLDLDYSWIGSLFYVLPVGREECLNANGNHQYGSGFYYLSLVKPNEGGGYTFIEENINTDNLQVKSSNNKILTVEIRDGHVWVKGIAEGKADVILKYTYQGKEYTNKTNWTIRPDPTPYFEVGQRMAVLLDNSNIELNKNEQKDVTVFFSTLTTMIPHFPEGYDESNYFICNWKSLDESIVKIKKGNNTDIATLEAISPGNAEVQCIVTTADGEGGSITKTVNVTVIGEEEKEYELKSIEPIIAGPNRSVIEIGKSVLTQVGLIDKSDGTIKEIDNSKLKVEISNPKLVSSNSNSDIIAKFEGIITVKYTYSIDNKSYSYEEEKFIISDRFSNGDIPVISNSVVKLERNSVEIYTIMTRGGTYAVEYPDGYNENNYFKYEWSIDDDKIAKIENVSDTKVKISPVANGSTKLKCIIKTADGKETITKVINITVSDNSIIKNDNIQNNSQSTEPTPKASTLGIQDTTSPKELPKAGIAQGIKLAIIVVGLTGIICYIRYKKIIK